MSVTTLQHDLSAEVGKRCGSLVLDMRKYAAGRGAMIHIADLQNGERVIVKEALSPDAGLELQGWMIGWLRTHTQLPLPRLYWADRHMLVLEWLEDIGRISSPAQRDAARQVAALHTVRAPQYGFERDTAIGTLRQPNPACDDWMVFFRDHRLMYMARLALEQNAIDMGTMRGIEKIAARLGEFIIDPAPPALIHGDLWGGNVMTASGRVTGFIDPAIYYADPEIELAFASLFGSFGDDFFSAYHEIHPPRDGFLEVRRDLYNLYPLLVHTRLFGDMYVNAVRDIVRRFTGV